MTIQRGQERQHPAKATSTANETATAKARSTLAALALALALLAAAVLPTVAGAAEPVVVPAPPSEPAPAEGAAPGSTTVEAAAPPASEAPAAPTPTPTPTVTEQHSQGSSPSAAGGSKHASSKAGEGESKAGENGEGEKKSATGTPAVPPSALTPALPPGLGSLTGIPTFFIESFSVPPFLLPIFQAAGTAYGIPWQVLAAVNEVETDYGRDLSVSSAGAEGWMQFLPSSWAQYGIDANGDGFADPYNPADAIFAAARYLRAAGGQRDIRGAIFSYNHSQSYVASVILRAQLLGGTPAELLGAITGLTEARFPVHALAHFNDVFPTVPASAGHAPTAIVGTSIYAQAGAPVIAVQDGEVVQVGRSHALGHFLVLRDAFGNTYTYGHLGDVAADYPVLAPHVNSTPSGRLSTQAGGEAPPSGPATAGAQPRSPLTPGATVSGLALGSAAALEAAPPAPASPTPAPPAAPAPATPARSFTAGGNDVFLHPLRAGVQVIAGTVLGHVGTAGAATAEAPHIVFEIRPAGPGAPLIDPKPILDGWVALENSSVFHAQGQNPFTATSPTVGQVLLESKQQLERQVLRDGGIALGHCGRAAVKAGSVDKRVLAALEYLSVSGLRPTTAGLRCPTGAEAASAANAPAGGGAQAISIVAVNGVPVAGHQTPGSPADQAVRKLLELQGLSRPRRIVSAMAYPHTAGAVRKAGASAVKITFAAAGKANAAGVLGTTLSPSEWIKLVARLGEIPDPTVSSAPSKAATPAAAPAGSTQAGKEANRGNH